MSEWQDVPVGAVGAPALVTREQCRTVMLPVDTVACGQRLLRVVAPLAADWRVQTVATVPPSPFNRGVRGWLERTGLPELPWEQAKRTPTDLVVTAGTAGMAEMPGPVVLVPHGAGFVKTPDRRRGRRARRTAFGLGGQWLVSDGRVVPAAVVLAHEEERARLRRACPEAAACAVVAGDPCADAVLQGRARRNAERDRSAGPPGRPLLVLSSTWGGHSLFASRAELLPGLAGEAAAAGWDVVLLLHPNIRAAHGDWQLQRWLEPFTRAGGRVPGAEEDWCAYVAAADAVVGDHGSVSLYATLTGAPVLRWCGTPLVDPASPMAALLRRAPALPDGGPYVPAVEAALGAGAGARAADVAARITSHPGRFTERVLPCLYRLLALAPPPAAGAAARGGAAA
ncbi:hypothetical protein [Nocardiopsis baichengensis]|uniref:hypothetical protein n=1 Tax=Nocardiopsis baichengensis TaxID=280240 RepID=UPI0003463031|nr:hypothetical protein [Nocardiopsis baichengensis]